MSMSTYINPSTKIVTNSNQPCDDSQLTFTEDLEQQHQQQQKQQQKYQNVSEKSKKIETSDNESAAASQSFNNSVNQSLLSESVNSTPTNLNQLSAPSTSAQSTRKMLAYYGRECICILVLIFTTYATYQNIPPKVSVIMPAKPFFAKGSLVHDWPAGQLGASQNKVALSELSLVLFYAPWCAESQHARHSYEYVARLFYREVHFAAINCWHPGGECRHQYGKVMSWPVLMAYMQNGAAVSYNGKFTAASLIRFVQSLLQPVKRITTPDQLLKFIMNRDAVVTLFLDMNKHHTEYKSYYRTASKAIEKDPFQDVVFTMVTGRSAEIFGVTDLPTVRLYLWNETLEFPNSTWTSTQLSKWVEDSGHQISAWVTPPGSKSNIISSYLSRGPALLVFTPRNLHRQFTDAYSLIRQIGLEYFNCEMYANDISWIKELARNYIFDERFENWMEYVELKTVCAKLAQKQRNDDELRIYQQIQQSISVSFATTANLTKSPENQLHCFIGPRTMNDEMTCANEAYYTPATTDRYSRKSTIFHSIDETDSDIKTSMLNTDNDYRSPKYLLKSALRKRCELAANCFQSENNIFFGDRHEEPNFDLISGMACKYNRTLTFLAMDSDLFHVFAERLGVDVLGIINQTVALIVDQENESTYILDTPVTATNLIQFIHNFVNGKLSRYLKKTDTNVDEQRRQKMTSDSIIHQNQYSVGIPDISSDELMKKISHSNKTTFILFYSIQCALCSLLTHHLIYVSSLLVTFPNVEFYRIDGDRNDLPWQYTMEKFPLLVAFAANGKSESRIFPTTLQVTSENILAFVLANLSRTNRLYAMSLLCQTFEKMKPFETCINVLRKEIMDNISYSLREWRFVVKQQHRQRKSIVRRLQWLQRFYLHLYRIGNSCDSNNIKMLDIYVKNILNVWTT